MSPSDTETGEGNESSSLLHRSSRSINGSIRSMKGKARTTLRENFSVFSDFALRDNVLEVAVGLIIASTFTAIVNSFVNNILLPPISLIPGISKNLDGKFLV